MKTHIKYLKSIFSLCFLLVLLTACGSSSVSAESGIGIKPGETIRLINNIAGGSENGWSGESDGTWSDGYLSVLKFDHNDEFTSGLNLIISMSSFVNVKNPKMRVMIKANNVVVKELDLNENLPGGDISVEISKEILQKNTKQLLLTFDIPNATVPSEIGWNEDMRRLGIWITQIQAISL
jgi:hypothetical protein